MIKKWATLVVIISLIFLLVSMLSQHEIADSFQGSGALSIRVLSSDSEGETDYECDGIDDEIQIQAAIDALPLSGWTIELSAGTFNVSDTLLIDDNMRLVGQGSEATTICLADGSNVDVFVPRSQSIGCHRAVFEHFKIDGNGANQSGGNGFFGRFYTCHFQNLYVVNAYDWGIFLYAADTTPGYGAQQNHINLCYFAWNGCGSVRFGLNGSDNHLLNSTSWDSQGTEDVLNESAMNIIRGCTIAGDWSSDYGIRLDGAFYATILNCVIDRFNKNGIYVDATENNVIFFDISHNTIRSCGKSANNTYAGIRVEGATSVAAYGTVAFNTYHDGWVGGNLIAYGIDIVNSSVLKTLVQGNKAYPGDYVTAPIHQGSQDVIYSNNLPSEVNYGITQ